MQVRALNAWAKFVLRSTNVAVRVKSSRPADLMVVLMRQAQLGGSQAHDCPRRNRRFRRLSALRAHTKAPYKTDLHRKTLMALNRPGRARTEDREADTSGPGVRTPAQPGGPTTGNFH
jgi:hypothetical protein